MTPNYTQGAHNSLADVKQAFIEGRYYPSGSARDEMSKANMSYDEMVGCVCALGAKDCTQSMTHQDNHKVWIDSYTFIRSDGVEWYLKVHPALNGSDTYFLMRLHPSNQANW